MFCRRGDQQSNFQADTMPRCPPMNVSKSITSTTLRFSFLVSDLPAADPPRSERESRPVHHADAILAAEFVWNVRHAVRIVLPLAVHQQTVLVLAGLE